MSRPPTLSTLHVHDSFRVWWCSFLFCRRTARNPAPEDMLMENSLPLLMCPGVVTPYFHFRPAERWRRGAPRLSARLRSR